jgi:hypothetical protein
VAYGIWRFLWRLAASCGLVVAAWLVVDLLALDLVNLTVGDDSRAMELAAFGAAGMVVMVAVELLLRVWRPLLRPPVQRPPLAGG